MTFSGATSSPGFEAYIHDVYGWAYRVLGHHHDALDVVQDVFLKWNRQCAADLPEQPRGWLRRVTLNRALDVRRAQQVRTAAQRAQVPTDAGREPRLAMTNPAEAEESQRALRDRLTGALAELSDMQRSVLVAKVYDNLTFAELAEEMGVAVSTVKTHYVRAVQAVRDRLTTGGVDEVLP
ncbi:MAG TPA: sigma-70 family RNA polymerase sigma factor [Phycisphaerae bacterium]|nr:sigma-70 family RNA polymerase sigma factor [Phycisphaerae bacterium]HNU46071.1 sigma-70 family RNA polymerase sigma factor [Phycisphaerae bacterium]